MNILTCDTHVVVSGPYLTCIQVLGVCVYMVHTRTHTIHSGVGTYTHACSSVVQQELLACVLFTRMLLSCALLFSCALVLCDNKATWLRVLTHKQLTSDKHSTREDFRGWYCTYNSDAQVFETDVFLSAVSFM